MNNIKRKYKGRGGNLSPVSKLGLVVALFLFFTIAHAQNPILKVYEDWNTASGSQNMFQRSVTRSITGTTDVVVCGSTVNSSGNYDFLLQKINASGTVLWSQQWNGSGNGDDIATDVRVASNGEIYVCGTFFKDTTDSSNAVVLKYGPSGNFRWSATYNGSGSRNDGYASLLVSGASVVAVGSCWSTSNQYDMLTCRLDTAGATVWTTTYDNSGLADGAVSLASRSGSIFVTGGVQTSSTSYKIATWKINPSTGAITTTTLSSASSIAMDRVNDVQEDASGNVYVAGTVYNMSTGFDFKVFKYDASLSLIWSQTWDGAASLDDGITGLALDQNGSVIVTGYTGTANGNDFATVKYSSAGVQQWASTFDGGGNDSATCIVVNQSDTNKIYVSGYSYNGSSNDYWTMRYDGGGNEKWNISFNNIYNGDDVATAIALDTLNNIIVTGQNQISPSTRIYTTVRYFEKNTLLPQDTISLLSTSFVYTENRGQVLGTDTVPHPEIKYYTIHGNPNVYFTDTAVSYVFAKLDDSAAHNDTLTRVDMKFVGSNSDQRIRQLDTRSEFSNFFNPKIPDGRCRVQNHNKLASFNVWNGVDIIYGADAVGMKYYFVCKPVGGGGSAYQIDLKYEGADSVHIGISGELMIYTKQGVIVQPQASVWQLDASGNFSGLAWQPTYNKVGTCEITFTGFGTYTTGLPLVIALDWGPPPNPQHINTPEWSMYFGGSGYDEGTGVCVDTDGNPYFAGFTASSNFPTVNGYGAYTSSHLGFDAYLSKFGSADGATMMPVTNADKLLWTTYYGGSLDDKALGVTAVGDGTTGRVYITGYTESSDMPTFSNAGLYCQTTLKGTRDAFIIGVDNDHGGQLTANRWATYFGGNGDETGYAVTNDGSGIYIGGSTSTTAYSTTTCGVPADNGFPTCNTTISFNNGGSYGGGASDGFISQFDNTGTLQWSTYYGGNDEDIIYDVLSDANFYVTGKTASTSGFPLVTATGGYNQGTHGGGTYDAFVGKFKTGAHVWCTYYGGSGDDASLGIVTDANHNIFIGGETSSSTPACTTCTCTVPAAGEFPMCHPTGSYFQGTGNAGAYGGGASDGFFAEFDNSSVMKWGTYYGGNGTERINDIDIDYLNQLYFTGQTTSSSPTANFVQSGPQLWYWGQGTLNGTSDAIIGYFDASQARSWSDYYSNYLLTTNDELGNSIAVYANSSMNHFWYMTGATNTPGQSGFYTMAFNDPNYGECCLNAYTQYNNAGSYDAFVTRFSLNMMLMSVEDMGTENLVDALVYPNPASESVTVNMSLSEQTDVTISVYSITGQLLFEQKYGKQASQFTTQVDFTNFAAGMYVLNITTDKGCVSKKVIKQF